MRRVGRIWYGFLILFINGCIEPYEFVITNKTPVLTVEGFISDVSYNETLNFPSNGRNFYVKLSYTSDVTNLRGSAVTEASVKLISGTNQLWTYTEMGLGRYELLDDSFKAMAGEKYKLEIILPDGELYDSEWQYLPKMSVEPIGKISFKEVEKLAYKYVAQEKAIRTVKGIDLYIDIPRNEKESSVYYLWDFEPTWIFKSPLYPTINPTCWVTNNNYLSQYVLHEDIVGGYQKDLFFVATEENERFLWDFSLLIRQFIVDQDYYQFLEDIQKQADESLGDTMPYNLQSNIRGSDGNDVNGFFAVVREEATRWYFNHSELSYRIPDKYKDVCEQLGGPVCTDCTAYAFGNATTDKPYWWKK